MAEIGAGNLTFADHVQAYGDDNVNTRMIPLFFGRYGIFQDIIWREATHMDKNVNTLQASEITASIGQINKGTPITKASTKQIIDEMGMLEAKFQVDTKIRNFGKKAYEEAFMTQARIHAQGVFKGLSQQIFYGQAKPTDGSVGFIDGILTRMNTLSGEIGNQVISGGGSGNDNASMVVVTWSDDDGYLFHPKDSKVGLSTRTLRDRDAYDADNNSYLVDQGILEMHVGLSMPNYKNSARVCNIDVSDLSGGSSADLVDLLDQAVNKLQDPPQGFQQDSRGNPQDMIGRVNGARTAIYMNRTVKDAFSRQSNDKTTHLTLGQAHGVQYDTFRGIPIRVVDTLLTTEPTVS